MSVLSLLRPPHRPRSRRVQLAVTRALVRTVGRTSTGIRLSFRYGLTSGRMLEYVYRNQPSGTWLIGQWIDRVFLSHAGWEAVRQRRRLLAAELERAVVRLAAMGRACRIVDLASGPADYLLELLSAHRRQDVAAVAIDRDERWVRRGQRLARRHWLGNIEYRVGDVLDRRGMLGLRPRPNLVVASGFYDWITDERTIARSVGIVREMLEPDGRFILTSQVNHFDSELVAHCFVDFRQQACRMTLRPTEQMNRLLAQAGFVVERTQLEPHGCYSVTVASRPGRAATHDVEDEP